VLINLKQELVFPRIYGTMKKDKKRGVK